MNRQKDVYIYRPENKNEYNFIVCYFLLTIMFSPAKVVGYVNFIYLSI